MKKFIYFAALLLTFCTTAQSQVQTLHSQIRLANVQPGASSDSVLVRGADKIIKFVPQSQIASGGGSSNLDSVLENGNMSMYSISLVDDINNATEIAAIGKDNLSISRAVERPEPSQLLARLGFDFNSTTPELTLSETTDNGETLFTLLAGNGTATLNGRTSQTNIILDFGTPDNVGNSGGDTIFYFPDLTPGSGGQVLATEAYVNNIVGSGGGALDLQAVTDNGSTTTSTVQVGSLGLFDSASTSDYVPISANDNVLSFTAHSVNSGYSFDLVAGGMSFLSPNGYYFGIGLPPNPSQGVDLTYPDQSGTIATLQATRNLINGVALNQSGTVVSNQDINVYVFTGAGTFAPTNTMPVGKTYKIRNNHGSAITIDPSGSTQINSGSTTTVSPGKTLEILWTGTNYITIGDY